jgi:hypothetical protein
VEAVNFLELLRSMLDQAIRADACPLDESESTRAEFVKLDDLWEQCLAVRRREKYLEEMAEYAKSLTPESKA